MDKTTESQASGDFQVGKIISEKRKEFGFSQGKLSELMKKEGVVISQKMISHYENGDIKNPDVQTVIAMGSVLGIDNLVELYFPNLAKTTPPRKDDVHTDIENGINYSNINSSEAVTGEEETPNLSEHKNEELSMRQVLNIMQQQANAAYKEAQARMYAEEAKLYGAKTMDRLTTILERMERRLDAQEGVMAVKHPAD